MGHAATQLEEKDSRIRKYKALCIRERGIAKRLDRSHAMLQYKFYKAQNIGVGIVMDTAESYIRNAHAHNRPLPSAVQLFDHVRTVHHLSNEETRVLFGSVNRLQYRMRMTYRTFIQIHGNVAEDALNVG